MIAFQGTHGGYGVGVNTPGCGPGDRGFKSHYSPQKEPGFTSNLVPFFCARSSMDRVTGFEPVGWGFESLRAYYSISRPFQTMLFQHSDIVEENGRFSIGYNFSFIHNYQAWKQIQNQAHVVG